MSLRRRLIVGLVAVHFALIGAKAFRSLFEYGPHIDAGPALRWIVEAYTQAAVMQADYSFFSPDISPDIVVTVVVTDGNGRRINVPFTMPNSEVRARIHCSFLAFRRAPEVRQLMARSWAARAYAAHPEAHRILVTGHFFRLPTMAETRSGHRSSLEPFFDVEFATSAGRQAIAIAPAAALH